MKVKCTYDGTYTYLNYKGIYHFFCKFCFNYCIPYSMFHNIFLW